MEQQLIDALSQPPIPHVPRSFMGSFIWGELDDDSGHLSAQVEHSNLIGEIVLDTREDANDRVITLSGTFNDQTHPCRVIPIAPGSNGGMTFQVVCQNNNKLTNRQCLWKRSFCKRSLATFISECVCDGVSNKSTVIMEGSIASVPLNARSIASLTMEERRGQFYIVAVSIQVSFEAYHEWLRRLTE